jgi:hypothetical protein
MPDKDTSGKPGRLKNMEDDLSEIKDTQNILELDIINLKNEIEKLKLVSTSPIPPDVEEKIVELENVAKDAEVFKKWTQTIDEVKVLRSKIMEMGRLVKQAAAGRPAGEQDIGNLRKEMDELRKRVEAGKEAKPPEMPEMDEIRKQVEELRKRLESLPRAAERPAAPEIEELKRQMAELRSSMLLKPGAKPPDTGDLKKAIEDNKRIIDDLRGKIPEKKVSIPGLEKLKYIVEENSKNIENLKMMLETKHHTEVIPDVEELKEAIEENKSAMEELKSRIARAKPSGPATQESGAMDARISELIDFVEGNKRSIEELKVRVIKIEGKGGAGVPERVEDEIEDLKELLYSKLGDLNVKTGETMTDDLKTMIIENRDALKKLERDMHATRTAKGTEFPLPMKDRIGELEKKVDSIEGIIKKGKGLKPIRIPEAMKTPSEKPSRALHDKIEKLRTRVDDIIKRVDKTEIYTRSLVRKEDLVALEKMLKSETPRERKLVSENVFKELDNAKKAILRNEDHITNLASDIEEIKRELTTIEKHEWEEPGEKPTLEKIIKRIEEIEHRLRVMGSSSPVFIE